VPALLITSVPAIAATAATANTRRHNRRIVIVIVVIDGMPCSFLCESQVGQEGLDAQG
jgi:hypothetical protein